MASVPPPPTRRRLSGSAYWAMLSRVVAIAAGINVAWLGLYAVLGSPSLLVVGAIGIALYGAAWWLLKRRRNREAVALIWLEVFGHATAGSLLIGWDSGFHYFLILFIPALVMGHPPRRAAWLTAVVLGVYAALYAASTEIGALRPLPPLETAIALWVNIVLVFGMFYAVAAFYRARVVAAERRLLEMATVDPLTGLANRAQFHARAAVEIARVQRTGEPIALVIADVDFFKRINDEHGHETGDAVLVRLAERLRGGLRECDVLARWGGEEFLALLPDCDGAGARTVAERLRRAVSAMRVDACGQSLDLTLSFGIAEVGGDGDLRDAVARADRALYRSKHEGRDRVTVGDAAPRSGSSSGATKARVRSRAQTVADVAD